MIRHLKFEYRGILNDYTIRYYMIIEFETIYTRYIMYIVYQSIDSSLDEISCNVYSTIHYLIVFGESLLFINVIINHNKYVKLLIV